MVGVELDDWQPRCGSEKVDDCSTGGCSFRSFLSNLDQCLLDHLGVMDCQIEDVKNTGNTYLKISIPDTL